MKQAPPAVTVVVPVYADWDSLHGCIESLQQHLDGRHRVILINDNGPEADYIEKKIQQTIANSKNYFYFRNPENLGFVKTCNRAVFELDKSANDILLLNSDTRVTTGFLEEMLEVLYAEPKVASVSPRSNNATIATVPFSAMYQKGIEPGKSRQIFKAINGSLPRFTEVPTVHGFCMLIRRAVIKKYGLFDEIFGKGYGEENDFCMRLRGKGYKNLLANRAFVYHLEARSFTMQKKSELIQQNSKILWKRYPRYRELVRGYVEQALDREGKIEEAASVKYRLKKTSIFKRALSKVKNT